MRPEQTEHLQNGQVELKVYRFRDPICLKYWLKAGACALEFDETTFEQLMQLLIAYDEETNPGRRVCPSAIWKYLFLLSLVLIITISIVCLRMGK